MRGGRRGRRGRRRGRNREGGERPAAPPPARAPGDTAPPAQEPHGADASASAEDTPEAESAVSPSVVHGTPGRAAEADGRPAPMSARELVARREAKQRAEALGEAGTEPDATAAQESPDTAADGAAPAAEQRRFEVGGEAWLAWIAGVGTGGTGGLAQARLAALRFARGEQPDQVAGELLVATADIDHMYDDELAALLERALRSGPTNG